MSPITFTFTSRARALLSIKSALSLSPSTTSSSPRLITHASRLSTLSRSTSIPKTTHLNPSVSWHPSTRSFPSSLFHTSSCASSSDNKEASQKPETRPCWKCANPVPYFALICPNPTCKVVQTLAPGANYFEVLGLSPVPTFDIDVKDLRNKFFKIQQQVHPDSYSQNTNSDQIYAQQQSTLANKAYATLKEPLSRAKYILGLSHAPIHESESLDNPELLMEVMEARELLEDAQTEAEVQDLKDVNDGRILETCQGLSDAFREGDLEMAKELAIKLQYWIRIKNVIRDWAAGKPVVADHV
ncbi:hypothetical protein BGZ93_009858 [Podila epicladia]|nr:hypothetical protein BGZ92_003221 [Podila epicladia]KAG0089435.1 hypothetical protein BGZ93_009858 [Podila epicladia]